MESTTGKRTARLRLTLNKRNVDALEPSDKPFIAWDDKLIGFGVRVHPSGLKSFRPTPAIDQGARPSVHDSAAAPINRNTGKAID